MRVQHFFPRCVILWLIQDSTTVPCWNRREATGAITGSVKERFSSIALKRCSNNSILLLFSCVRGHRWCACPAAGEPLVSYSESVGSVIVEEYLSSRKSLETSERGLYFNGSASKTPAIRFFFYTHYRNLINT